MNKKMQSSAVLALSVLSAPLTAADPGYISGTQFNPAVSVILDGRYNEFDEQQLGDFALPGFMIGGEAGFPDKGFSTGHNELSLSANVDDKFYGKLTAAVVVEDGNTEVELEEAWFETLGLGYGFTIGAGRFFSRLGYLNQQHEHNFDFVDAPLVYQAMVGGKLIDEGVQFRWLAPTDFYLELGAEWLSGKSFPGGDNTDGNRGGTAYIKTGGDIGVSNSWQLGLSAYTADFNVREGGGHAHGGDEAGADIELENGETDIYVVDLVYKWAPNGNASDRNFKFQAEYFQREEKGEGRLDEGGDIATADYDGEQDGFYVSAVYQFIPRWRVGIRYDQLSSDNRLVNFNGNVDGNADTIDLDEFGEDTGLGPASHDPESVSLMLDYSHSEFSRLRFQVSNVELQQGNSEPIFTLQYIMSLGAHGAHKF